MTNNNFQSKETYLYFFDWVILISTKLKRIESFVKQAGKLSYAVVM